MTTKRQRTSLTRESRAAQGGQAPPPGPAIQEASAETAPRVPGTMARLPTVEIERLWRVAASDSFQIMLTEPRYIESLLEDTIDRNRVKGAVSMILTQLAKVCNDKGERLTIDADINAWRRVTRAILAARDAARANDL